MERELAKPVLFQKMCLQIVLAIEGIMRILKETDVLCSGTKQVHQMGQECAEAPGSERINPGWIK